MSDWATELAERAESIRRRYAGHVVIPRLITAHTEVIDLPPNSVRNATNAANLAAQNNH